MKIVVAALALIVALGACTSSARPRAGRSSTSAATTTILAQNLALYEGETQAIRLGFEPASGSTDVIVDYTPDTAQVALCSLTAADGTMPPVASCKSVGSGVRETVSSPGLAALGIVLSGTSSARADILLEFDHVGRHVSAVIPFISGGGGNCADNGCNPFFEVRPVRNGLFTASARWNGASATLVMLQGSVLARSQTATGIPYRKAAIQTGQTSASIRTQLTSPGEYALAITQTGTLRDVRIDASWP